MLELQQWRGVLKPYPQLLLQLALQPPQSCFTGLELTPRKFPQATLVDLGGAAGDENSAIATANDRSHHMQTTTLVH
jgi:hypothetical protein